MKYSEIRTLVMETIKEETIDYQNNKDNEYTQPYNYGYVKGMLSLAYILGYISKREYNDYDTYLSEL
jgi:hypothetical protein